MKFTDEELQQAAIRLQQKQLAQLPPEETCSYEMSPAAKQQMQELITQVNRGKIGQAPVRMGWQYYARRGTAAILLCFFLACLTMPEVVLAGCQKLIEVVETIFEEYTEFHYTSNAAADTEFVPLTLNYIPDGLEEVEREKNSIGLRIAYADSEGKKVFVLRQELLTEDMVSGYIVDTENAQIETVMIQNEEVLWISKGEGIQFIWVHEPYRITGQARLSQEELTEILQQIELAK